MNNKLLKKTKKNKRQKTTLNLVSVTKRFTGTEDPAVDNVNLKIPQGDLFVLVGPSGCGKSTLLKMIAGFENPSSGKIYLDKEDITAVPPHKRPLNMMFQSYALFPHMNVWDNIAFGLRQEKNVSEKAITEKVESALEMVMMQLFAHRKPDQLSGGQKQRVALARSLIKRPKLLLLDEPLGALDRKIRENTQVELIKIQILLNTTFIVVTHDQEEAMSLADRMAVMHDGKILQVGTPEEIYETPNSKFVAEFIGSINLFKGTVAKSRNKKGFIGITIEESDRIIMAKHKDNLPKGQEVWLGLRPEEVEVDIKPAPKTENQVSGTIIDCGFLGQKIIYYIELKNKKIIHASMPTSEKARHPNFLPGKTVFVSWWHSDGVVLLQ